MSKTRIAIFVLGFLLVEPVWPFGYLAEYLRPENRGNDAMQDLIRGRLIGGGDGMIYSLDLKSGERTVLLYRQEPDVGMISVMGRFSDTGALVRLNSVIKGKKVATYDLSTGKLTTLVDGWDAMYSAAHGKLVYHRYRGRKTELVISSIGELDAPAEVIVDDVRGPVPGRWLTFIPVPISGTEFLFEWGGKGIWLHSFETGKSQHLAGLARCSLDGAFWIVGREQLFCSDRKVRDDGRVPFLLTDLQGNISREINLGRRAAPVAYNEEVDGILVQRERAYLKYVVFAYVACPLEFYDFSSGVLTEVFSDPMMSGLTVWMGDGR